MIALLLQASLVHADSGDNGRALLKLKAQLDHEHGYCLDIPGFGEGAMLWKPLIAHNCKPGRWGDQLVTLERERIRFPAYERCVTAAGVKDSALPGAAVLPRSCEADNALQRFRLHEDGRLERGDSGLCLTVGGSSSDTWNRDHRWRTLYLANCSEAPERRSRWVLSEPLPDEGSE